MSLPTGTDLATLSYASDGQPFTTYQPSTADTLTLGYVDTGQPIYAQGAGAGSSSPAARPVIFTST